MTLLWIYFPMILWTSFLDLTREEMHVPAKAKAVTQPRRPLH